MLKIVLKLLLWKRWLIMPIFQEVAGILKLSYYWFLSNASQDFLILFWFWKPAQYVLSGPGSFCSFFGKYFCVLNLKCKSSCKFYQTAVEFVQISHKSLGVVFHSFSKAEWEMQTAIIKPHGSYSLLGIVHKFPGCVQKAIVLLRQLWKRI